MKSHQDVSDHEETAQPLPRRKLGAVKRTVTLAAVLFTAFHVFATFLWIAPSSALRDVVPGNALESYMIPMFGQSWSVFAQIGRASCRETTYILGASCAVE